MPGDGFHRLDLRGAGPEARTALHRRRTRLGGRQPVHLPGHGEGPPDRLGVEADDPRGHHPHAALAGTKPLGAGRSADHPPSWCEAPRLHERRRPRPVAPRLRDRRLLRGTLLRRSAWTSTRHCRALRAGKAPLFEPGLDDLLRAGLDSGRLRFAIGADAARSAPPTCCGSATTRPWTKTTWRTCLRPGPTGALPARLAAGRGRPDFLADPRRHLPRTGSAASRRRVRLQPGKPASGQGARHLSATRSASSSAYAHAGARAALEPLFAPFCEEILWMRPNPPR